MYANKVDIIIFDENSNHRGPPYCFYVSRILIAFNLIGIRHKHIDKKKSSESHQDLSTPHNSKLSLSVIFNETFFSDGPSRS